MSATWRPPAQTAITPDVEQSIDLTAADVPGKPYIIEMDDDSLSTEDLSQPKFIRSAAKQGDARLNILLTSSDDDEGTGSAMRSLPTSSTSRDAAKDGRSSANRLATNCGTGTKPGGGPEADKLMATRPSSTGAVLAPSKVTPMAAFTEGKPSSVGSKVVSRSAPGVVQAEFDKAAHLEGQDAAQRSAGQQARSAPAKPAANLPRAGVGGSESSQDRQPSTAAAGLHAGGGGQVARLIAGELARMPETLLKDKDVPANRGASSATSGPGQAAGISANQQDAASGGIPVQVEDLAMPAATGAPTAAVPAHALPEPTESPQPTDSVRASAHEHWIKKLLARELAQRKKPPLPPPADPERASAAAALAHASAQPGKPLLQPAGSGRVTVPVGAAPSADGAAPFLPAQVLSPGLRPVSGLGGSNLKRRPKPTRMQQASSLPSGGASASLTDPKPVCLFHSPA